VTKRNISDLLLHNFPENGVKFLLHNPGNLGDLIRFLALRYKTLPDPRGFDFVKRTIEPDTLIRSDFRKEKERAGLQNDLERSIQAPAIRKEISEMGQTIAEALRAEGERKGKLEGSLETKQEMLVISLQRKFGRKVTSAMVASVKRTTDHRKLDELFGKILDAKTLEEVGLPAKK
jgi:hypothetical protein